MCSDMDRPRDDYTRCSQSETDRQPVIPLTGGIEVSIHMHPFTKQKRLTGLENKLLIPKGDRRGWGAGINQEVGINVNIVICMKSIINKHLLHSAGNSTL